MRILGVNPLALAQLLKQTLFYCTMKFLHSLLLSPLILLLILSPGEVLAFVAQPSVAIRNRQLQQIQTLASPSSALPSRMFPEDVRLSLTHTALHLSESSDEATLEPNDDESTSSTSNKLLSILSTCTSAFPLFVLGAAILGLTQPQTLQWVNEGNLISLLLAAVMCGTGLTLRPQDFQAVLKQNWSSVPLGVACQFGIMPFLAWAIGKSMLLGSTVLTARDASSLFLGLVRSRNEQTDHAAFQSETQNYHTSCLSLQN